MSHSVVPPRERTFQSIQYLRAVAALMVVAYHVKVRIGPMGYHGDWPEWLSCGVDIFFVISGFIMWTTTYDRPARPLAFIWRRLLRIAPLYWLVTGLVAAVSLAAPSLVASGRFDLPHTIASLAFLPHLSPTTGTLEPVVPQGWTLNYEMQFYGVFALCLMLPLDRRRWALPLCLLALTGLGALAPLGPIGAFYTSSLLLEFGFGVVVAMALASGRRMGPAASLGLIIAGVVALVLSWPLVEAGVPRVWLSGLAATAMVGGAAFREQERPVAIRALPRLLGDGSYSIYLVHGLAMSALAFLWVRLCGRSDLAIAFFVPVGILGATIAGLIVHLVVERPLLALGRRLARGRRPLTVDPVPLA